MLRDPSLIAPQLPLPTPNADGRRCAAALVALRSIQIGTGQADLRANQAYRVGSTDERSHSIETLN